ncbi:twitching motility protein PilT [Xenorhabdus stockiae]|uniref:Twitching motility protein PilT n=1 Tax=Xenorhabdus stockiae TaxID=351614 RepID=A0A2D0KN37_9GAMM|nr:MULTISPECIES: type II toxin-antitoxin system VapC family toxin [Xenorhabdus]PHM64715.1 twitching motility protein PilT [Xenorhabdus stockiae]PHM70814.1 twitching motility protein PilT [Xenorhabdus sp. KJ12.1]
MRYLLDTHILLWYLAEPAKLKKEINELLRDTDNEVYFSAVSIQEIAIKRRLGRSDYSFEPAIITDVAQNEVGFLPLMVTIEHSLSYYELPIVKHRDPFDLMLVAQAKYEGIILVTNDEAILTQFTDFSKYLLSNR